VIGNVFGPNLSAESIVVQAGTTGGRIENNSFRTDKMLQAKSWVALMGNGYVVTGNLGAYAADTPWRLAVALSQTDGWGQDNTIAENQEFETTATPAPPFFVPAPTVANLGIDSFTKSAYLILPARVLPYTLSELAAYFPETVQTFGATALLRENLLVGNHASLRITTADAHRVRLLSTPERFVSLNGFNSQIDLHGSATQQLVFESWDVAQAQPDVERYDGRAYVLAAGGRMDIADAGFFDLGYEEGTVSGVSWKSLIMRSGTVLVYGNVSNSHFVRNFFGAYTYEAVDMRWIGNTFAHNIRYGFDPHDFSDYFLVEANVAHNNGSHGIIFSRGCRQNIIRNNQSYDNAGHGIMLDDGRVVPDGENERHLAVVPSDNNVIEGNLVTNNDDGIVIEGGSYNIIRNNTIIGPHRYGIRLKDNVAHTEVISNTIENSERFAIFVHNNSIHSRIEQNTITGAAGALFLQDAPTTTVTANVAQNITELVIALQGNVAGSHIADNRFSGAGQQVFSQMATGLTVEAIVKANDFTQWRRSAPPLLPIVFVSAWLLILLTLAVAYIRRTIQRRRARPDQYQRMPL
jgi:parallel beta-helix repeat protein